MKIYFERSGGFMGMPLKTSVDTAALPNHEGQALEDMLSEAQFFGLPASLDSDDMAAGADQLTYTLTVVGEQETHTVCMTEMAAPSELRPLLRRLTLLARQTPGGGYSSEVF